MEGKICIKCKEWKPRDSFNNRAASKDGLNPNCKSCIKKYRNENREKISEQKRKYNQRNKEKIRKREQKYRIQNKEKINEQRKRYRNENAEKIATRAKKYREKNREKLSAKKREYNQRNKEKIAERRREYNQRNKQRNAEYIRQKRRTNPLIRLRDNMRNRTYEAIINKGYTKRSRTRDIIGCSWEELKGHIESQFIGNMEWQNYGTIWSIDHRIPLASAKNKKELLELCRYDNLQPLWTKDNIRKSDKLPHEWAAINS